MGAKDSRSSRCSLNNYPHNMPTITPTTHTPIPPGNCGAQFPSACALGNCSRNSSHPSPSHYGCVEMGPMEPGRDGTQLGKPPGGCAMASLGCRTKLRLLGAPRRSHCQTVGKQLVRCVLVLGRERLRT
jgi:hypothetical protein